MTVRGGRVRSTAELLETAAAVLAADPGASLSDVAAAAGIGRTTLHKHFASRHDLLVAVARAALDELEALYGRVGLDAPGEQVSEVLRRLLVELVPMGPRLAFLLRERSLDAEADVRERYEALDEALRSLVIAGQRAGTLRVDVPSIWIVASLNGLVCSAWEQIETGRLARFDAPALVLTGLLSGMAVPQHEPTR